MGFFFFSVLNHEHARALEQRPKKNVDSSSEVSQIVTRQSLNNLL